MGIPIGRVLQQAGLVNPDQVKLARSDQEEKWQPLGEILAARGFINKETVDFFVNEWPKILSGKRKPKLEDCLLEAKLISTEQLKHLRQDSNASNLNLGTFFVLNGWVKETTINFFLESLAINSFMPDNGVELSGLALSNSEQKSVEIRDKSQNPPARQGIAPKESEEASADQNALIKILKSDIAVVPKMIQSLWSSENEMQDGTALEKNKGKSKNS